MRYWPIVLLFIAAACSPEPGQQPIDNRAIANMTGSIGGRSVENGSAAPQSDAPDSADAASGMEPPGARPAATPAP